MMMTRHDECSRAGFALPSAIMALVLLSALVAGALFVSTEELRAGRGDVADQRALAAAEWSLERAIATWEPTRNAALAVGATAVIDSTASGTGDGVVVRVTRVQRDGFWITAAATSGGDGRSLPARHTIGASLRLVGPRVPTGAALTAGGAVIVDNGFIDGRDMPVAGAAQGICDEDYATDAAAVAVPDPLLVCGASCSGAPPPGVIGTPPIISSSALTSDSTIPLAGMTARASITVDGGLLAPRPVVSAGECDRSDPLNWGDPTGASRCADWLPVIHVRGSVSLAAGSMGQGTLIVDGALRVETGARFVGVVVVGDDVTVTGSGAELVGVVVAGDADRAGGSRVADGGVIRLGRCAARRAALGASRLVRTPVRWWAELR
jgi:hypothetical protein